MIRNWGVTLRLLTFINPISRYIYIYISLNPESFSKNIFRGTKSYHRTIVLKDSKISTRLETRSIRLFDNKEPASNEYLMIIKVTFSSYSSYFLHRSDNRSTNIRETCYYAHEVILFLNNILSRS